MSRQRWLFYAYDSLRKTVVAHVFGERTMATLGRLMSLLSPFDVVIWMTDGWPLYESRLKGKPTPSVAEQEGQLIETEATGAPQKHHHTLNQ